MVEDSNNEEAYKFLQKNNLAVLSTVDDSGQPISAVVYYVASDLNTLHFITKTSTRKYRNILTDSRVSICVYDEEKRFTIQAEGQAVEEHDQDFQIEVLNNIARVMTNEERTWLPPVSRLKDGKLVVIKVNITNLKVNDFNKFTQENQ